MQASLPQPAHSSAKIAPTTDPLILLQASMARRWQQARQQQPHSLAAVGAERSGGCSNGA